MNAVEMKTADLIGSALDWAVSEAEDEPVHFAGGELRFIPAQFSDESLYAPSTDWNQGGPLIEKHGIEVFCNVSAEQAARFKDAHPDWRACMNRGRSVHFYGQTPLIAAMRCMVASKLGETVQVPRVLLP